VPPVTLGLQAPGTAATGSQMESTMNPQPGRSKKTSNRYVRNGLDTNRKIRGRMDRWRFRFRWVQLECQESRMYWGQKQKNAIRSVNDPTAPIPCPNPDRCRCRLFRAGRMVIELPGQRRGGVARSSETLRCHSSVIKSPPMYVERWDARGHRRLRGNDSRRWVC